jgi:methylmalonyl-CoA mutase cobalamin-binding domain/chain
MGLRKMIGEAQEAGLPPDELLLDVISPALNTVGELWSQQKAALTQVYMAGRLAEEATASLLPQTEGIVPNRGVILLGNAPGDYHGLGRHIVATYLRTAGLDVVDLGLSVSAETFVEQTLAHGVRLIAISALMVHTAQSVTEVRRRLDEGGAVEVKILVGGAPFNFDPDLYRRVGAQAMGHDAGEAVHQALALLEA